MPKASALEAAIRKFADSVHTKMSQLTHGEPEDQLRGPFETFMHTFGEITSQEIVCTGETLLPGRLGKPDYAVHTQRLLTGFAELKAPGVGTDPRRFRDHNRDQFNRFKAIPNLLYCDGNEFALFRSGELTSRTSPFDGDIADSGAVTLNSSQIDPLHRLLTDFFNWQPLLPTDRRGRIDLQRFAAFLAPLCRMLRNEVTDALQDATSPLVDLAKDWRSLLFPDASDEQFADAYAQTVTFALLLARSEGADPLSLDSAEKKLAAKHTLLSRALQVLTDTSALLEISTSLNLLQRVIGAVPPATLTGPEDPWLYFYEDFLAAYDPDLRRNAGAYYTPVEVVRAQVRLVDDLLTNRLGKPLGFADKGVITLDPAVGTGTYLLGVIQHALDRIRTEQGAGAVPGQATALAANLYGFEIMTGPYAVSELRVTRALIDAGAALPSEGTQIYLTDTLESPHSETPELPLYLKPIAEQHRRALRVKEKVPVIVCIGNPPYDRHEAADAMNKAKTGGWVRWGDDGEASAAILNDFVTPAIAAGHAIHIKNTYNLYVYFWRWALWKVFEHEPAAGPGVVSYISASSYLDGDAFSGMREHMRRICDEIWILDLGGEGRGTRRTENVFAIQTPVAIAVAVRYRRVRRNKPAAVHYATIVGTRAEKLQALASLSTTESLKWQDCPADWQAPFRPAGAGDYFSWPLLTDLLPWQHSGAQFKRTWPIGPDSQTLKKRWAVLMSQPDRGTLFRESRDRKVTEEYPLLLSHSEKGVPISELSRSTPSPDVVRYAYRSFDRQLILADNSLGDFLRPVLWYAHSQAQIYLSTLLNHPLGSGPALTCSAYVPDLHHFRGSYGAKEVIPLFRDSGASQANIAAPLLSQLSRTLEFEITPAQFLAYVYGILAHPAFTASYADELATRELRVPITKDTKVFRKVCESGTRLLWLHTYGERFIPKGEQFGRVPQGRARCVTPIPGAPSGYPEKFEYRATDRTLFVGSGTIAPVDFGVYDFEVSGLKVVQSWLKYRMKDGAGKKSSPLDDIRPERWTSDFTTELLELLWVLEATLEEYPKQAKLLEQVIGGPCFAAAELPEVPDEYRKPPRSPRGKDGSNGDLFEDDD